MRIYEIQHDWKQAAAAHERLRATGVPEQPAAIAHYYCEMAEAAMAEQDYDTALAHLRSARDEQHDFGRSAILRGDLARRQGDPALALRLYQRVVRRDFHLLALVLPRLAEAARQAGIRARSTSRSRNCCGSAPATMPRSPTPRSSAVITTNRSSSTACARCSPSTATCATWRRRSCRAGGEVSREQLRNIAGALRNVVLRHARYRCSECGIDSSDVPLALPGLPLVGHVARRRGARVPAARGTAGFARALRHGNSCDGTRQFLRRAPASPAHYRGCQRGPSGRGVQAARRRSNEPQGDPSARPEPHFQLDADRGGDGGPVNVNAADAATIARELDGIGPAKAQAIVEYRQKNGPFRAPEDLLKVDGIGEKVLEQNRGNIQLDKASGGAAVAQKPAAKPASKATGQR